MQVYEQSREEMHAFLTSLQAHNELIAPVKEDLVRFQTVEEVSDIYLEKNAYFPLKEYFFRKHETVFLFIGQEVEVPKVHVPKRVFFGIRKCDLNAIHKQDRVFMEDGNDPYYTQQRQNVTLIGYHCSTPPSEACFCGSLDLKDYFDLMYYDYDGAFLVEVGSSKGQQLVQHHPNLFNKFHRKLTQDERKIHDTDRLEKKDIANLYENPGWKEGVNLCLSCGACTTLCPTCYCFEFHDEVRADNPEAGSRERSWSSCMLHDFTRVAGDHVFRKDREQRFKHRVYHQLDYFKDKYNEFLCVGCGRCIDGCPTRIDFVDIINRMDENANS